jgi:hypothetical protein
VGCCVGAGLSHFGDAEVDAIGQYCGEQKNPIFRQRAGLQCSSST